MRIAISTDNGQVAQHFGRCSQYTIIDIEDSEEKERKIIDNPGHSPGAIPQFLNEKDCDVIIAGGMGRKAQGYFKQYGIDWIVGVQGDIDIVIQDYIKGKLENGESLCTRGNGKGNGLHGHRHF